MVMDRLLCAQSREAILRRLRGARVAFAARRAFDLPVVFGAAGPGAGQGSAWGMLAWI